jgi:hypothetical protein
MSKGTKRPDLYPTRKWWATQISATTTLAVAWVNAGTWNKPLTIAAIGVISQAAVVYLVPNGEQPARPSVETRGASAVRRVPA